MNGGKGAHGVMSSSPSKPSPNWDPQAKWVRVVEMRANGMVEFEFAVGEPQLYVEMVMPRAAFEEFCAMHAVTPTAAGAATCSSDQPWDWNWRAAHARYGHTPR